MTVFTSTGRDLYLISNTANIKQMQMKAIKCVLFLDCILTENHIVNMLKLIQLM